MCDCRKLRRATQHSTTCMYPNGFSHVGGLEEQIAVLREIILFPLLYEHVYEMFGVKPARGVLFHGPPGTGKTLVAGALAGECLREAGSRVSFFSQKGADVLDKWFGESEKKLERVFSEAAKNKPAIIFFDEMDGLAPTRSTRNEHIHISIVATLLSLMDGLDSKCGVIVIGATNRVDALDPALRRPGRFDRELYFPLPSLPARIDIIKVHVSNWTDKPSPTLIRDLAEMTVGCNGADLRALCCNAVVCSLKRSRPPTSNSLKHRKEIMKNGLKVLPIDFINACGVLKPRWQRQRTSIAQPLPIHLQPLLRRPLEIIVQSLYQLCPYFMEPDYKYSLNSEKRHFRSIVLTGGSGQAQDERLAPALLHRLEHLPCTVLDVAAMYGSSMSTEEACLQVFQQAKSVLPSVLYVKNLESWWTVVDNATRLVFSQTLHTFDSNMPLLLLATNTGELPKQVEDIFDPLENIVIKIGNPSDTEKSDFFSPLFYGAAVLTPDVLKARSEKYAKINVSTFSILCMENTPQCQNHGSRHNPDTCLMKSDLFDTINKNHSFEISGSIQDLSSGSQLNESLGAVVKSEILSMNEPRIKSDSEIGQIANKGKRHSELKCSHVQELSRTSKSISKKKLRDKRRKSIYSNNNKGIRKNEINKLCEADVISQRGTNAAPDNFCRTDGHRIADGRKEQPCGILIDREELSKCFKRTVQVTTRDYSVMALEKLYRVLETVVANYAEQWIRQGLILDIKKVLTEFETGT